MSIKRKQFFYSQYFWHQMCEQFSYTNQFLTLWTPTGFPTNQFWHYPDLAGTPQVKGSVPQDCPPLQMPITTTGLLHFWPTSCKLKVPPFLFSGWIICYNCSQNSRKHFTCTYQFIIKDMHWERCVARIGVWSPQTLYWHSTFPAPQGVHQPGKLSEPRGLEFLSRFHYVGTVT